MPSFNIVNDSSKIKLHNNKWTPSTKFNSKDRLVDAKGKAVSSDYKRSQYRIIEKRERTFSSFERIGRGFLGITAVACTLFFGLFSKNVRDLFVKQKVNIRFGVRILPSSSLKTPIPGSTEYVSKPNITEIEKDPLVNIWKEKKLATEELIKLAQNIYNYLSKINGSDDRSLSSTSWTVSIFFVTGEIKKTIGETWDILNSFVELEKNLKQKLAQVSRNLSKSNPEIPAKILIPNLPFGTTSNRDLWNDYLNHIKKQDYLSATQNEDQAFFKQLQLIFGDKGIWFNQIFKKLESIYEYNSLESQKFGESYNKFLKRLEAHNLSLDEKTKQDFLKMHKLAFKLLDELKEKLQVFNMVSNDFEKVLELAHKISM